MAERASTPTKRRPKWLSEPEQRAWRALIRVTSGVMATLDGELRIEHGFKDSYQSVKRYVRKLGALHPAPFRRMESAPAIECQVDFGKGAWVEMVGGKRKRPWVS